jgi:hypothetical protein
VRKLALWVERRRDVEFDADAGEYAGAIVDDIRQGRSGEELLLIVPRGEIEAEYEIIKHVTHHEISGAPHYISEYEVKVISCLWLGCAITHGVINADEICWEIDND